MTTKLTKLFQAEKNDSEIYDDDNYDNDGNNEEAISEEIRKNSLENVIALSLDSSTKLSESKENDGKVKKSKIKVAKNAKSKTLELKKSKRENDKSPGSKNTAQFGKAFFLNIFKKKENHNIDKESAPEENYDVSDSVDNDGIAEEKKINDITKGDNVLKIDEIYDDDEQDVHEVEELYDIEEAEDNSSLSTKDVNQKVEDHDQVKFKSLKDHDDSDESFDEDFNYDNKNKKYFKNELSDLTRKLKNYLMTAKNSSTKENSSKIVENKLKKNTHSKNVYKVENRGVSQSNEIYDDDDENERMALKDSENNEIYDDDSFDEFIPLENEINNDKEEVKINDKVVHGNDGNNENSSMKEPSNTEVLEKQPNTFQNTNKELKQPLNKKVQMLELNKKKTIASFKLILNGIKKKLKEKNYNDVYDCDENVEENNEGEEVINVEDEKGVVIIDESSVKPNLQEIKKKILKNASKPKKVMTKKQSKGKNKKEDKEPKNNEIYDDDDDGFDEKDSKDSCNLFEEIYEDDDEIETFDKTNYLTENIKVYEQKDKTSNDTYESEDLTLKGIDRNNNKPKNNKNNKTEKEKVSNKKNKMFKKDKNISKEKHEVIKATSKFYVSNKSTEKEIQENQYDYNENVDNDSDGIDDNLYEHMIYQQIENAEDEKELTEAIESIKLIFESNKITSSYVKEMSEIKFLSVKDRIKFYENVSHN